MAMHTHDKRASEPSRAPRAGYLDRTSYCGPSGEVSGADVPASATYHLPHLGDHLQPTSETSFGLALRASLGPTMTTATSASASWSSIPTLGEISTVSPELASVRHLSDLRHGDGTWTASSSTRLSDNPFRTALGELDAAKSGGVDAQIEGNPSTSSSSSKATQIGSAETITSRFTGEEPSPLLDAFLRQAIRDSDPAMAASENPVGATSDRITSALDSRLAGAIAGATADDMGTRLGEEVPFCGAATHGDFCGPLIDGPRSSANPGLGRLEANLADPDSLDSFLASSSPLTSLLQPPSSLVANFSGLSDNRMRIGESTNLASLPEYPASEWGQTSEVPAELPRNNGITSRGFNDTQSNIDLTKTNELLQQLLDETRRVRQPFLPLRDK